MIAFLNERSLEAHSDWSAGLQLFLLVAQEFAAAGDQVFRDGRYFLSTEFKRRFNTLAFPKDQRALVLSLVFSDRYCPCWTPRRESDSQTEYSCEDPAAALIDESLCEAAERARANLPLSVAAISTLDSVFGDRLQLRVSSGTWNGVQVELRNATALAVAREFIAQRRGQYDRTSHASPRDFQTILERDTARFLRSGRVERRGRRIFQEIETRRFYYVDDAHDGHVAHLEVFSESGEHLGIADIDTGVLDESRRVEGRRLRL
jgi:hypothetical protein